MDWMPQAIREGIFVILFISGPLVILAAGLGLAIGIVQAATQVQEQTLGSAVKILGVFLALIVFGFYIFSYLKKYTSDNIKRAFKMVPTLGSHPMPRKNFMETPIGETTNPLRTGEIPAAELEAPPSGRGMSEMGKEPEQVQISRPKVQETLPQPPSLRRDNVAAENRNIREQPIVNQAPARQPVTNTAPPSLGNQPAVTRPVTQAPAQRPATQATTSQRPATQAPRPAQAAPVQRPATQATAPARPAPAAPVATRPAPVVTPAQPSAREIQEKVNADRRAKLQQSLDQLKNTTGQ